MSPDESLKRTFEERRAARLEACAEKFWVSRNCSNCHTLCRDTDAAPEDCEHTMATEGTYRIISDAHDRHRFAIRLPGVFTIIQKSTCAHPKTAARAARRFAARHNIMLDKLKQEGNGK